MKQKRNYTIYVVVALLALFYWWVFSGLKIEISNLAQRWETTKRIFVLMTHWNDEYLTNIVIPGIVESVQIAIIGTTLSALLALPFGFLAARNIAGRTGSTVGKNVLNLVRTFPELILAIMFISGVGPGALAGILAVGIHSIGFLGKMYAEVVEAIDRGPTEAMLAAGANRTQVAWFAIIPQVLPEFASYAIYRFELNVRAASVLGLVGAGGIGMPLTLAVMGLNWGEVGMILAAVVVVVLLIDYASTFVRSKLV